jgi:hypothetical protein
MDMISLWVTSRIYGYLGFDEKARIYNDFAEGIQKLIKDGIEPIVWTL